MPNYSITGSDHFYRRVPKYSEKNKYYWKNLSGIKVPTSFAFKTKPHEDGLSVNIAELITPEATVANYPNNAVSKFSASIPINEGYNCIHKPSKDNNSHAIIEGDTNPIAKKLSKAVTQVFQF